MVTVCYAFRVAQGGQNSYEAIAFKLFAVMLGDWQYDYLLDMLHVDDLWWVPYAEPPAVQRLPY